MVGMDGKLSVLLVCLAMVSIAGVGAAQPCQPTCTNVTDGGTWAVPGLAPAVATLLLVALLVTPVRLRDR